MIIEVKVPTPGESITEVELANWLVANGDLVRRNQDLAEIESDKATLSLTAPESGKLEIVVEAGSTVKVNAIACRIDTSVEVPDEEEDGTEEAAPEETPAEEVDAKPAGKAPGKETRDASAAAQSELKSTPLARSDRKSTRLNSSHVRISYAC